MYWEFFTGFFEEMIKRFMFSQNSLINFNHFLLLFLMERYCSEHQNISDHISHISLAPIVFQLLRMHYATSMFGNANSSLLCSNIALHAAYITGHSYHGIIHLFFRTTVLLVVSQQMQILLGFIMWIVTVSWE